MSAELFTRGGDTFSCFRKAMSRLIPKDKAEAFLVAVSVLAQRFSSMRVTIWLMVLIPLGAVGGACYHAQSQSCQSTDDAFIDGHIINVAPLVAGRVDRVLVDDNQVVKKGDLVVVLDNRNFVATSNQKVAALDNVRAPEVAVKASIEQAIAHVAEARAALGSRRLPVDRKYGVGRPAFLSAGGRHHQPAR